MYSIRHASRVDAAGSSGAVWSTRPESSFSPHLARAESCKVLPAKPDFFERGSNPEVWPTEQQSTVARLVVSRGPSFTIHPGSPAELRFLSQTLRAPRPPSRAGVLHLHRISHDLLVSTDSD